MSSELRKNMYLEFRGDSVVALLRLAVGRPADFNLFVLLKPDWDTSSSSIELGWDTSLYQFFVVNRDCSILAVVLTLWLVRTDRTSRTAGSARANHKFK